MFSRNAMAASCLSYRYLCLPASASSYGTGRTSISPRAHSRAPSSVLKLSHSPDALVETQRGTPSFVSETSRNGPAASSAACYSFSVVGTQMFT